PHGIGVSVLCPMIVQTAITANSMRNRPAALRNPGAADVVPDADDMPPLAGGIIPVEEVSGRVVRAIDRGDFYVLTHPEQREILRPRAARQAAMVDPDRWLRLLRVALEEPRQRSHDLVRDGVLGR